MHLFQMTSDYIPLLFSSLADSTSNANANANANANVNGLGLGLELGLVFFEESGDDH